MAGVTVGISGANRSAGEYVGHFEVSTGPSGAFALMNVPPETDYVIYGTMNSLKDRGAIAARPLRVGKDGETTDAGDLSVGPAHRLAGRVVLADGAPVPENTRLLVSREKAWDSMQVTLDKDGGFDTGGIPAETVSLSVRLKGYRVSSQNKSLDPMNLRILGTGGSRHHEFCVSAGRRSRT